MKNSDPELFSQAWNKLPRSARENILSYLKKYPNLLEREYPLLLLHRMGQFTKDEMEGLEGPASKALEPRPEPRRPHLRESIAEPKEPARKKDPLQRVRPRDVKSGKSEPPLYEWSDGELLAHTTLEKEKREEADTSATVKGKADSLILAELRKISRQNRTQIVQNELMRRLLQTLIGKS